MNDVVPQYPWAEGDHLFASALNAAIADGPYLANGANNVLNFGADPTGVADSSAAINAAAAQVASGGSTRHKAVYLPTGTYRVNNQITLTAAQCMFGDSRGSSVLMVDQAFNPTATSVVLVNAAFYDTGPVLRDFGITFEQPQDQGSRANFRTLASGGTSRPGGTGVMYPWAIAAGDESIRIQCIRLRIAGAWNGITTNNHNALYYLDDIEMGALNIGVSYGRGTAVLDFSHIIGFHYWNFGIGGVLYSGVYRDGQNIALYIGNPGSLNIVAPEIWNARMVVDDDTGRGDAAIHITGGQFDGDWSTIEVLGIGMNHFHISNIYGSASVNRPRPFFTVAAPCRLHINNYYSHSSSLFPDFQLTNAAANVILSNFYVLFYNNDTTWVSVQQGLFRLVNGTVYFPGPRTVPAIAETSSGHLMIDKILVNTTTGTGTLVSGVNTASTWSSVGQIGTTTGSAWTFALPSTWRANTYNPGNTFTGSVTAFNLFTTSGIQAGTATGTGVNMALASQAGGQKAFIFYRGATNAWAFVVGTATDDFSIWRYSDAGSFLSIPFGINRATGRINMTNLASSTTYASDAAAATGGVAVGELYRNGSVVQVRVV